MFNITHAWMAKVLEALRGAMSGLSGKENTKSLLPRGRRRAGRVWSSDSRRFHDVDLVDDVEIKWSIGYIDVDVEALLVSCDIIYLRAGRDAPNAPPIATPSQRKGSALGPSRSNVSPAPRSLQRLDP